MAFVNRKSELEQLAAWWARDDASIGIVWGRRPVGKTALIERFAEARRAIFHTGGGRPAMAELAAVSRPASGRRCWFWTSCRLLPRPRRSCPA